MAITPFGTDVVSLKTVCVRAKDRERGSMKVICNASRRFEEGKVGWALLWLLGVPIPVLLILFLLRGCT
jgi:hypothetical protein